MNFPFTGKRKCLRQNKLAMGVDIEGAQILKVRADVITIQPIALDGSSFII